MIDPSDGVVSINLDDRDDFDASGISFDYLIQEKGPVYPSDNNVIVELIGNPNDNILIGTSHDDVLLGKDGNDTLIDDELRGGYGTNTLVGGVGDDLYFAEDGIHQIFEYAREGVDNVVSSECLYLYANVD